MWLQLLWLLPLILVAGICIYAGAGLTQPGDAWFHLAIIRRIMEAGTVDVPNPYQAIPLPHPYPQCWHALLANFTIISGLDRISVWELLPGLIYPLFVVGIFRFAFTLTKSVAVGAVAAFLLPLCPYGGISIKPDCAGLTEGPALILLWVALSFFLDYLSHGGTGRLLAVLFLIAGNSVFHPVEPFLFLVAGFSFFLFLALGKRLDRPRAKRFLITGVLSFALCIPYPLVLLSGHMEKRKSRPGEATISLTAGLKRLPGGLLIVDPTKDFYDSGSIPVFYSFLLSLFLLKRIREDDDAAFLAGNTFTPLFLLFCPPAVLLLAKLGFPADFLYRFYYVIPYPMVLAVFLRRWWLAFRNSDSSMRKRSASIALVLLTVILVFATPAIRSRTFWNLSCRDEIARFKAGHLDRVLRSMPSDSTIATDPATADFVPEVCGGRVVCGMSWHMNSNENQAEVRDLFKNPHLSSEETSQILRRLNADLFLLNLESIPGFEWPGFRENFYGDETVKYFLGNPDVFRPIKQEGNVYCFRWDRTAESAVFFGKDKDRKFHEERQCPEDAGGAAVEFESLSLINALLSAQRTGQGTDLVLDFCWEARSEVRNCPLFGIFVVPADFAAKKSGRFSRILRVLRENVSGKRELHYFSFRPWRWFRLDGRFLFDVEFRSGERFSSELKEHLPENLPPGLYEIYIGFDDDVPPFPKPVSPVLGTKFTRIGSVEIGR
jgi:hypothetical protein